jgi:hypothetical protein
MASLEFAGGVNRCRQFSDSLDVKRFIFHPPADIENSGLRYGVFFIFLAKKELNLRIKRWMSAGLDQMLLNSRMQQILLKIG